MTPKEFLTQSYRIDDRIKSLERELNALLRDVPIAQYNATGGHSSEVNSPTECKTEEVMKLEEMIRSEKQHLENIKLAIHTAISNLENVDEQLVLRYRYIECSYNGKFLAWAVIAEKMHFELRQIYRVHGKALEHLKF